MNGPSGTSGEDRLNGLERDYRIAFLRYLPHRSEEAVTAGYELGRHAATTGAGLLDLVRVHHDVLRAVLVEHPTPDVAEVTDAAGDFLAEVLSTFDMAHRVLHDTRNGGRPAAGRPGADDGRGEENRPPHEGRSPGRRRSE